MNREYVVLFDLVDKMLEIDPKKRIRPLEAFKHDFFKAPMLPSAKSSFVESNKNVFS